MNWTWNDKQELQLERIESDLSVLYSNISPVEYELREKVWDAWNLVMDIQIYLQNRN